VEALRCRSMDNVAGRDGRAGLRVRVGRLARIRTNGIRSARKKVTAQEVGVVYSKGSWMRSLLEVKIVKDTNQYKETYILALQVEVSICKTFQLHLVTACLL
jgi:hypothetical protein